MGGDRPDNLITLCSVCHEKVSVGRLKLNVNDAFVIAIGYPKGSKQIVRSSVSYLMGQVRKCNRKLFKGNRSDIRNSAKRFINGFQRFDKVLWKGKLGKGKGVECFVFGRRSSGYFDLRKVDGTKIHPSVKCKQLTLLESAKTLLCERKNGNSSHSLKGTGLLAVNL